MQLDYYIVIFLMPCFSQLRVIMQQSISEARTHRLDLNLKLCEIDVYFSHKNLHLIIIHTCQCKYLDQLEHHIQLYLICNYREQPKQASSSNPRALGFARSLLTRPTQKAYNSQLDPTEQTSLFTRKLLKRIKQVPQQDSDSSQEEQPKRKRLLSKNRISDDLFSFQDILQMTDSQKSLEKQISETSSFTQKLEKNESDHQESQKIPTRKQSDYQGITEHSGSLKLKWDFEQIYLSTEAHLTQDDLKCEAFDVEIKSIKTLSAFQQKIQGNIFNLNISCRQHELSLGLQRQDAFPQHYVWFAKIINAKLVGQGKSLKKIPVQQLRDSAKIYANGSIQGQIYEKSKQSKSWQKRHVLITEEGLFSYKDCLENYDLSIKRKIVSALWTRFDYHDSHLIIKIKHDSQITQFAIPIVDFSRDFSQNWLLAFYRLMFDHHLKQ